MSGIVSKLSAAIEGAQSDATENELLKWALRPVDLSPWSVWTLLSLVAHTERQRWVTSIVQTKLSGSPEALAAGGSFGHPNEVPQQGVVPGLIDWEYYFHGRGCCLTNRRSGEAIDVDFFDDSGDWIDPWFYSQYLKSLKAPGPIEKRLLELHPKPETTHIAIQDLTEHGLLLLKEDSSKIFRVADDAQQLLPLVDLFAKSASDQKRLQAAIAVGDWLLASEHSASCGTELRDVLDVRSITAKDERIRCLNDHLASPAGRPESLTALCTLNPPELPQALRRVLQGPPGPLMSRALEHLEENPNSSWGSEVFALFQRLRINGDIPEPYACMKCARILLKVGHRVPEVLERLRQANHRDLAEVSLLLLEHQPQFAREHFRKALRSQIPIDREEAAAVLAVLAEPWCKDELLQALRESSQQYETAPLRAALTSIPDQAAHAAVHEWEKRHPHIPSAGPLYTFEDMSLNMADGSLQYQMDKLHDRVLPLRGRVK